MKKFVATLALVPLAFGLAACGSSSSGTSAAEGTAENPVVIGVVGSDPSNDKLVEVAAAEGIHVELKEFTDYAQPNPALSSGDIDMNWFQHIAYLSNYNVEKGDTLQIVGPTVIYPMALFSSKHDSIDALPEGAEIAIPNDPVNEARALFLLEANGLVKFTSEVSRPTVDDVDTAASKVKVTPVDAAQTVIAMESVDASAVNNDYLADAGLNPKDALAQDDPANETARPYVNLFVATEKNADNEVFKKLNDLYHTEEVQAVVQEDTQGTAVEVTTSVEDLRTALKNAEEELRNGQ